MGISKRRGLQVLQYVSLFVLSIFVVQEFSPGHRGSVLPVSEYPLFFFVAALNFTVTYLLQKGNLQKGNSARLVRVFVVTVLFIIWSMTLLFDALTAYIFWAQNVVNLLVSGTHFASNNSNGVQAVFAVLIFVVTTMYVFFTAITVRQTRLSRRTQERIADDQMSLARAQAAKQAELERRHDDFEQRTTVALETMAQSLTALTELLRSQQCATTTVPRNGHSRRVTTQVARHLRVWDDEDVTIMGVDS